MVQRLLPRGGALPADLWAGRHRTVMVVLWFHVAAIPVFSTVMGDGFLHGLVEALPVALLGGCASIPAACSNRARATLASLGLLAASGIIVHLGGGMTELHFHFFVMIALIALYQDWVPFLAAVAFTLVHHLVLGSIAPHEVYDHADASSRSLTWAAVHASFLAAASLAQITSWRVTEAQYERSEEALRTSERWFRSLIEHSTDGICVVGNDGTIVYDSPSTAAEFGLPDRAGKPASLGVHPDDLAMIRAAVASTPPGGTSLVEHRLEIDGVVRWVEAKLTDLSAVPGVEGLVVNFRDVTKRRELERELAHQAFHDALTGLPNRALFSDRVGRAIEAGRRGGNGAAAVLFVDLDDFKTVNDALGHQVGDQVLVEAARRITAHLGAGDSCARLGGDEFGVLLDGVDLATAYEVGEKILEAMTADVETADGASALSVSIGLACSRPDDDADDLIRNADLAMYKAKASGKSRLEIFEDGMREAVLRRLDLKVDLRRALEAGEFVPHYQPLVSLATGKLVGAEALVRWEHPERGVLAPGAFIDLAEESGVIVGIGRHMLTRACIDAAAWPGATSVSVNLSPRQLQDDGLVDDVAEILDVSGLAPSRLTLEITEGILVADPEAAARVLGALKALGLSIALDDFGTGFSSLSYLNRFPVDSLKIDKSFVDRLGNGDGNDQALLQAIVGLGRTLELTVVAEGIERVDQWHSLKALGCGLGQGYLFAKPMPNAAFVDFDPLVLQNV